MEALSQRRHRRVRQRPVGSNDPCEYSGTRTPAGGTTPPEPWPTRTC